MVEVRFDELCARNLVPGAKSGGLFTVGKDFVGKAMVRPPQLCLVSSKLLRTAARPTSPRRLRACAQVSCSAMRAALLWQCPCQRTRHKSGGRVALAARVDRGSARAGADEHGNAPQAVDA